jgi:hypothetical protein
MDPTLIAILIKDIAIPEILAIIRAHKNATGKMPTDAEVIAALDLDVERFTQIGQNFLDRTRGGGTPTPTDVTPPQGVPIPSPTSVAPPTASVASANQPRAVRTQMPDSPIPPSGPLG